MPFQSPLSRGLFHRAIAQSGTSLAPWGAVAHKGVAKERAKKLGEILNCPHNNENNLKPMIDCLRKASAKDITEAFYDFFKWDTGI